MGSAYSACEGCFTDKANDKADHPRSTAIGCKQIEEKHASHITLMNTSRSTAASKHSSVEFGDRMLSEKSPKACGCDFDKIKVLGRGSYGKVYLVKKKTTKKHYALKTLKKEQIFTDQSVPRALSEKIIMQNASHPFIVKLHYTFQDPTTLSFVMDYCPGGDLFTHMKKIGPFNESTTQFYAAEVILALQYIHEKLGVIYRDLKLENILIDRKGHIKITDFGMSINSKKAFTFCGTPEYIAPEIINLQGYNDTVDWWSLGCLIFEMLSGYPPFYHKDTQYLFRTIINTQPVMPSHFSDTVKDLLQKLFIKDPAKRLGAHGVADIKKHKFFANVNWDEVLLGKRSPPFVPFVLNAADSRNFDAAYTRQASENTPVKHPEILKNRDDAFPDFTYQAGEVKMPSYADFEDISASKQQ